MRVLEQVDPGVLVGAGMDEALDHSEQRPLSRVGVHTRSRTVRIGYREEVEKQRQVLGEGIIKQQHSPRYLLARLLVGVGLCDAKVVAHHLQHR